VPVYNNLLKKLFSYLSNHSYLALAAILFLGLLLRGYNLTTRALWLDEADAANLLKNNFFNLWQPIFISGNNPGYIYLLKVWSQFFGDTEAALRSLSLVLGLASIFLIYKFGRLLFNRTIGLMAGFLLAINYFSIFYSIQARQYSLVVFLSLSSYYFFSELLIKGIKWPRIFLFILTTSLGLYTHPWFFLLVGSQILFILIKYRARKTIFWSFFLLIVILSWPRIIQLISLSSYGANDWIAPVTAGVFFKTFSFFTFGATGLYFLLIVIASFFIFIRIEDTSKEFKFSLKTSPRSLLHSERFWLLINYLISPLLAAFIISKFTPFYETGRYEAIVLPAFILLLAGLFSKINDRRLILTGAFFLILFSFKAVIHERDTIKNYQNNEKTSTALLLDNISDGSFVVFTGLSRPSFDYYLPRLNIKTKKFKEFSFPAEMAEHAAYRKRYVGLADDKKVIDDWQQLLFQIEKDKPSNLLVVYDETDASAKTLIQALDHEFKLVDVYNVSRFSSPLHFQYILNYQKQLFSR